MSMFQVLFFAQGSTYSIRHLPVRYVLLSTVPFDRMNRPNVLTWCHIHAMKCSELTWNRLWQIIRAEHPTARAVVHGLVFDIDAAVFFCSTNSKRTVWRLALKTNTLNTIINLLDKSFSLIGQFVSVVFATLFGFLSFAQRFCNVQEQSMYICISFPSTQSILMSLNHDQKICGRLIGNYFILMTCLKELSLPEIAKQERK